jgi:hypothetical protein
MFKLSKILTSGLVAGVIAVGAGLATTAQADTATKSRSSCFFTNSWQGWSSPSPNVLLLRVNMRDVYRVELSGGGSSSLNHAGYFLVNQVRGPNTICSALDLDLAVADHHGFYQPLIARSLTKLTPAEVAAIPKKYRP